MGLQALLTVLTHAWMHWPLVHTATSTHEDDDFIDTHTYTHTLSFAADPVFCKEDGLRLYLSSKSNIIIIIIIIIIIHNRYTPAQLHSRETQVCRVSPGPLADF